jgi:hypothetical protein
LTQEFNWIEPGVDWLFCDPEPPDAGYYTSMDLYPSGGWPSSDPPYQEDYDPQSDYSWVIDSGGSTDITDPDYDAAKDIAEDYLNGDPLDIFDI